MTHLFRFKMLIASLAVLGCFASQANVLVLVHGWRSNADSWVNSGVYSVLVNHGWQDAGITWMTPTRVRLLRPGSPAGKNKFYRVSLPANLGLQAQAEFLRLQLNYLRQLHVDENFIIAAHSAGGVVSRLVLVQQEIPEIKMLITIATPHLGTPRAIEGLDIGHSKPFFCPGPGLEIVKNFIGGEDYRYLRHSDTLLLELVPARQGTLLNWLNHQTHPDIQYHSIIKQDNSLDSDGMAPVFSQDMNHVQHLRGRSSTYWSYSKHALNPQDGVLIINILESVSW